MGKSYTRRIRKNLYNISINEGKTHLNSFSGATVNRLDHFVAPILEEYRPDIVIIHVGSNDITHNIETKILKQKASQNVLQTSKRSVCCMVQKK